MRTTFLVQDAFGVGGTNHAVFNLANALAADHLVRVVSVLGSRTGTAPSPALVRDVEVLALADTVDLGGAREPDAAGRPSALIPPEEPNYRRYGLADDERLRRYLAGCDAQAVVGTRPGLNLCVARLAPASALKITQEHMTWDSVPLGVREAMAESYPGVDAVLALTEADATGLRAGLPGVADRVHVLPNAVPASPFPPSRGDTRIVMAAGRLVAGKRYDVLIRAWRRIAEQFPDWQLRIHGTGPLRGDLVRLIAELGLHNQVFLMGRTVPLAPEWVKASVAVSTSESESFGLTLVEAMRAGVPVVATDCPVGPREIIRHGVGGVLTPVNDVGAIADALAALMSSTAQRRVMGAAALHAARRYDPSAVARDFARVLQQAGAARPDRAESGRRAGGAVRRLGHALLDRLVVPGESDPARPAPEAGPCPSPDARSAPGTRGTADCRVRADGAVVLVTPAPAGATALELRGRKRHPEESGETVRISLLRPPTAALTAVIGSADLARLGSRRWDVHLVDGRGRRTRLRAGHVDGRELLTAVDRPHLGEVCHTIPYRTDDGHLALRSWRRVRHAEITGIGFRRNALTLRGRLYGSWPAHGAPLLVLRRRQTPRTSLVMGEATLAGADFDCRIPAEELLHNRVLRQENWDVFLSWEAEPEPTRAGRILDDTVNRKTPHRFPELVVEETTSVDLFRYGGEPTRIAARPYYTADNDLSVVVTELS